MGQNRYQLTLVCRDRRLHSLAAATAPAELTLPFDDRGINFSSQQALWRRFQRIDRGSDWATYEEAVA